MLCKYCGKEIDNEKHNFCPNCGKQIKLKSTEGNKIRRKELKEVDKYWERTKYPGT